MAAITMSTAMLASAEVASSRSVRAAAPTVAGRRASFPVKRMAKLSASKALAGRSLQASKASSTPVSRDSAVQVQAAGAPLGRKLKVAVIGGGPAGACAAETLSKGGVETYLIERKLDNCKPCGGAIPLCMVDEFDLPEEIIDRKVTKMKMISPSNREVDVGRTLSETEYIGMCRREVMDDFLRRRAEALGASLVNGLLMSIEKPSTKDGQYVLNYNDYSSGSKVGVPSKLEVDVVIGADGANSRVAKEIDAGDYDYAIAFQVSK